MPTLHDVQLLGVRRAEMVDEGLGVLPDRIDDQRVALVMPDRFAVPGGFDFGRMGHVHIDMTDVRIFGRDDQDFLGRLDEIERPAIQHENRSARRLAGGARRIGDLAFKDLVIVLLHDVLGPLLQIGIGEVGDAIGRLHAQASGLAVADMGMGRIVGDGTG